QLSQKGAAEARDAEQVANLVHESIWHARQLAHGLSPIRLEDGDLPSALRQLAERLNWAPSIKCECRVENGAPVDSHVALHLYRIAQEAVSNAVRHGKAQRIDIRLENSGNRLGLTVTDNGVGFPRSNGRSGLGLRLMSYRARAIEGHLEI